MKPNLEWIEDVHCDSVGSLVGKVSPYPTSELLEGLPDVDRLSVVIVESVHAAAGVSDSSSGLVCHVEQAH